MNKLFKQFSDFLIQKGKEVAKDTINDVVENGKQTIKEEANKKVSDITKNFFSNEEEWEIKSNSKIVEVETVDAKIIENHQEQDSFLSQDYKEKNAKYRNGEQFEKNLRDNLTDVAKDISAKNPLQVINALKTLSESVTEVSKFTEVQITERINIEAQRDVAINRIQSQKEIILAYLNKSFDERKDQFDRFFNIVDDALAKDNMQQLALALDSINKLAVSSPFKELANIESTQKALNNKNHIWDF